MNVLTYDMIGMANFICLSQEKDICWAKILFLIKRRLLKDV